MVAAALENIVTRLVNDDYMKSEKRALLKASIGLSGVWPRRSPYLNSSRTLVQSSEMPYNGSIIISKGDIADDLVQRASRARSPPKTIKPYGAESVGVCRE